jgi:aldose 1-epimerase
VSERPVLRAGALELHLRPEIGGSIGSFDRLVDGERRPLMRGTDQAQPHVLEVACFPLVPFCNRIRGGAFECDGRTVQLAPNMPPDASPLHGQGWLSRWSVVSCDAQRARLRYHHEAGEWPWSYGAEQTFDLDTRGLSVTLTCRNLSGTPMPCGMGLHPYFPCDAETLLDTQVDCAWMIDEAVLPVERVPAQGRFDLRMRRVCALDLDNGFGGWEGSAQITWPDGVGLSFSSPDAAYFQLYSPPQGGLFVAEPVQHANAALNEPRADWETLGLSVLAPGEARELKVRFDVSAP